MAVILDGAEVRVHGIQISCRVAVIGLGHGSIGGHRRGPQRGHAKLAQIIQMLLDAGKVSAMPALRGSAIVAGMVLGRITLGETVGHDKVKHVGGREALMRVWIA